MYVYISSRFFLPNLNSRLFLILGMYKCQSNRIFRKLIIYFLISIREILLRFKNH